MAASYTSRSRTARNSFSSSTALSHTINSIDDTKASVVIEIGKKLTKCGYSGEFTPRSICRTEFYDEECTLRRDALDGYENGKRPNITALTKFLKKIFYNHLIVEPRDRRVIIVENILCPSEFRTALCTVLFEKLDVPSVLFLPSHLCATLPLNTANALVVDVGYRETFALPFAEGVTMLNHSELSAIGGQRLEEYVANLLKEHGFIEDFDGEQRRITEEEIETIKKKGILEDICVQHLFCTTRERGLLIQEKGINAELEPKIKDTRIIFGVETIILPGFVREAACEIFFADNSDNESALPSLIFNVISKLPIDLRRQMFNGLLLIGGPSMLRNFLPRLQEELIFLGKEHKQKAASTIKFFQFENESVELYLSWLGGSMFSAMREATLCRSVSRQHWLDHKVIPDWTDFVQHNRPCGRTDMMG